MILVILSDKERALHRTFVTAAEGVYLRHSEGPGEARQAPYRGTGLLSRARTLQKLSHN